jgi:hypothetical protein
LKLVIYNACAKIHFKMKQKTQKQNLIFGTVLVFVAILLQLIGIDSLLKADSLPDVAGIDTVVLISLLISAIIAFVASKFLTRAITYNWAEADAINPYPGFYKKLIILGITTVVTIICFAIKFSKIYH